MSDSEIISRCTPLAKIAQIDHLQLLDMALLSLAKTLIIFT